MKCLPWLILAVVLIGCGTSRHASMQRFGIVMSEEGHFGSFIVAGEGYAYVAKHVVALSDSTIGKFYLFHGGAIDSTSYVVASEGDVVLVRTSLGQPMEPVGYASGSYAEQVVWVQPHFSYERAPHLYVIVGRIARFEGDAIYVDRAVVQGVSGSGVWNMDGKLLGMMYMITAYEFGAVYGIFTPIPDRLQAQIVPREKPPLETLFNGRSP